MKRAPLFFGILLTAILTTSSVALAAETQTQLMCLPMVQDASQEYSIVHGVEVSEPEKNVKPSGFGKLIFIDMDHGPQTIQKKLTSTFSGNIEITIGAGKNEDDFTGISIFVIYKDANLFGKEVIYARGSGTFPYKKGERFELTLFPTSGDLSRIQIGCQVKEEKS